MGERIDVINGLRGVAILSVIWHHINKLTTAGSHVLLIGDINFNFLPLAPLNNGWLGVNLFFVLSGFVLFLPFARGKRPLDGASDFKSFYFRRAKRLLPLFYISLAAFMAIDFVLTGRLVSIPHLLLYVTATFNFDIKTFFPYNNWVLWSLGLEILFSIIFPFLVLFARRFSIGRLLMLTLVMSLTVRYIGNQTADLNIFLNPVRDSIFGRLDDFVIGMWLCHVYLNPPKKTYSAGGLIMGGALAIFACCSLWDYMQLGLAPIGIRPLLYNLFQLGIVCIIFPLLTARKSRLRSALTVTSLQIVGMMTFSLYVWHGRLIYLMAANADAAHLIVYFITLFSLSALTYRFIEFRTAKDWRPLFLRPSKDAS